MEKSFAHKLFEKSNTAKQNILESFIRNTINQFKNAAIQNSEQGKFHLKFKSEYIPDIISNKISLEEIKEKIELEIIKYNFQFQKIRIGYQIIEIHVDWGLSAQTNIDNNISLD